MQVLIIRKMSVDLNASEDAYRSKIRRFDLEFLMNEQFLRREQGRIQIVEYFCSSKLLKYMIEEGDVPINKKVIAYYYIKLMTEHKRDCKSPMIFGPIHACRQDVTTECHPLWTFKFNLQNFLLF